MLVKELQIVQINYQITDRWKDRVIWIVYISQLQIKVPNLKTH